MEELLQLLLLGLGFLAFLTIGSGVTLWLLVRRIKRSGVVKQAAEHGRLTLHSYAVDPITREPARLILELRRSVQATRRALAEAVHRGRPVGELPGAARELEWAALSLEDQLRIADREPNRELKRELSAGLAGQARALEKLSVDLRRCLLQTSWSLDGVQLQRADVRLRMEISAMHSWMSAYGARQAS